MYDYLFVSVFFFFWCSLFSQSVAAVGFFPSSVSVNTAQIMTEMFNLLWMMEIFVCDTFHHMITYNFVMHKAKHELMRESMIWQCQMIKMSTAISLNQTIRISYKLLWLIAHVWTEFTHQIFHLHLRFAIAICLYCLFLQNILCYSDCVGKGWEGWRKSIFKSMWTRVYIVKSCIYSCLPQIWQIVNLQQEMHI